MEIIYKPKKGSLIITLMFATAFMIAGCFFVLNPEYFASSYFVRSFGIFGQPISIQIIGVLSVVISGLMFIGTSKLFFDKYILLINEKGFINKTNFINFGLIPWKDVVDIRMTKKKRNSMIYVYLKNKRKYYKRKKNPIDWLNIFAYDKVYGTAIVIETAHLTVSEDELFEIFKKYAKL